jgi:hypothetical protein
MSSHHSLTCATKRDSIAREHLFFPSNLLLENLHDGGHHTMNVDTSLDGLLQLDGFTEKWKAPRTLTTSSSPEWKRHFALRAEASTNATAGHEGAQIGEWPALLARHEANLGAWRASGAALGHPGVHQTIQQWHACFAGTGLRSQNTTKMSGRQWHDATYATFIRDQYASGSRAAS